MFCWNFICISCFFLPQNLAKKADERCSQFDGLLHPLVECPAYDLDPNYYECYDEDVKDAEGWGTQYWCWNRLDNDETILKNLTISAAYVNDDLLFQQINQPFTSIVHRNETHTICGSNENWATPYNDSSFYCPTSAGIPVAVFKKCIFENPGW